MLEERRIKTYRVAEGKSASSLEWRLASSSPSFLRPLLGRAWQRRRMLARGVNWRRVLFVAVDGEVAGYLQFYLHGAGPHQLSFAHMRDEFGITQAAWRFPLYQVLHRRFRGFDAYLYRIVVTEPFRGQGLGQRLLEAWLALLEARGVAGADLEVWGNNPQAMTLYSSLGFVERRRLTIPVRASWLRDRQLIQMHRGG
ncbi:GNAT family N-acetyltransferase [Halomonas lysinitropha]|uniref:Ribosomal-protein-alanine N-acetyltransferase n=1 Tax=Halomonas lysinitropha TaxID=2607506 RepID=A0A5K1I6E7_9GAMM|nr:GNAT family N-acetyltransferase [Halomonas lysinitropha]VVZ95748.1 ribosomal-protein-alanine N-acetyltransferase [Halomonas lysinitropha]